MLRRAQAAGYDMRIGLEDTLVLPTGREARDDAALVTEAVSRPTGASSRWQVPEWTR